MSKHYKSKAENIFVHRFNYRGFIFEIKFENGLWMLIDPEIYNFNCPNKYEVYSVHDDPSVYENNKILIGRIKLEQMIKKSFVELG